MLLSKRATLLILLAALLCSTAKASEAVAANSEPSCFPPPEGKWLGEMFIPLPSGGYMDNPAVSTDVTLKKEGTNIYTGTAEGTFLIDVPPFKAGTPVLYQVLGLFDEKSCAFSGANYNHEATITDVFRLESEGLMMSGPAVGTLGGKLLAPFSNLETLRYVGEA